MRWQNAYENGTRSFTAVMYNLQGERKASKGYGMFITFDPIARSVLFVSYSPFADDYVYYDKTPENEMFVLKDAF